MREIGGGRDGEVGMTEGWLYGWKAICEYLGCSVSTAKRYHYHFAMPVYRSIGKPSSLRWEIDEWKRKMDEKSTELPRSRHFRKTLIDR